MNARARSLREGSPAPERRYWTGLISGWKANKPLHYEQHEDGPIKVQHFIERLHVLTEGDAVVTAGVGQHQMWASQFWGFNRPRSWINSGGSGTMGFAVPAAVGAKVARPEETVIALDGDGCFQMTSQEMITAAVEKIPVKVVVFNNAGFGMVKQWQKLFYGGRMSASVMPTDIPDFPALAEAMGCVGMKVTHPSEIDVTIEKALAIDDRPVLIEVVVDPDEMCFPMVPAGGSNDDVITGPEDLR
jgi:acetolactate synthase-1/2/3 large subunit